MVTFKILFTRAVPSIATEILTPYCEITQRTPDRLMTPREMKAGLRGKEGVLCTLQDQIDDDIMAIEPKLRVISNFAVGFNNIDLAAATRRKIIVCHTPGVLTETTADLAFALIMACARQIPQNDRITRESKRFKKEWGPMAFLGADVHGKILGIIGFGRIGQAVARRGLGFGMKIIYYTRTKPSPEVAAQLGARGCSLEELLSQADFVSLNCPLTSETHHLIGEKELGQMKPAAYLINTARGPVVDEAALVRALKRGVIAGAGLDVYEHEPEVAKGLVELENTVLLPHVGSATMDTRNKMAEMAAHNLLAGLQGRVPEYLVNQEVLEVLRIK